MVAGNVFRALGRLAGIGDRAYWLDGQIEVPYLHFPALSPATEAHFTGRPGCATIAAKKTHVAPPGAGLERQE